MAEQKDAKAIAIEGLQSSTEAFLHVAEKLLEEKQEELAKGIGTASAVLSITEITENIAGAVDAAKHGNWDDFSHKMGEASANAANTASGGIIGAVGSVWDAGAALGRAEGGADVSAGTLRDNALSHITNSLSDFAFRLINPDAVPDVRINPEGSKDSKDNAREPTPDTDLKPLSPHFLDGVFPTDSKPGAETVDKKGNSKDKAEGKEKSAQGSHHHAHGPVAGENTNFEPQVITRGDDPNPPGDGSDDKKPADENSQFDPEIVTDDGQLIPGGGPTPEIIVDPEVTDLPDTDIDPRMAFGPGSDQSDIDPGIDVGPAPNEVDIDPGMDIDPGLNDNPVLSLPEDPYSTGAQGVGPADIQDQLPQELLNQILQNGVGPDDSYAPNFHEAFNGQNAPDPGYTPTFEETFGGQPDSGNGHLHFGADGLPLQDSSGNNIYFNSDGLPMQNAGGYDAIPSLDISSDTTFVHPDSGSSVGNDVIAGLDVPLDTTFVPPDSDPSGGLGGPEHADGAGSTLDPNALSNPTHDATPPPDAHEFDAPHS